MANEQNLKPFKKNDPRINRHGRPRSFDALRKLALRIGNETFTGKDGQTISRIELILRDWSLSRNPQLQRAFVEYAFGKVPDQHEVTGKDGGALKQEVQVTTDGISKSILAKLLPEFTAERAAETPGETEQG